MRVEVELTGKMSRRELFRALSIVCESAERLARKMTENELAGLESFGAALTGTAQKYSAARKIKQPATLIGDIFDMETRNA